MLDVIGHVAQLGDGKHRGADDVFIVDEAAVLGVVGVALGAEAQSGGSSSSGTTSTTRWVATVFSSSMKVMTCPGRMVVGSTFYVDEGAYMVGGFHGAGQDGEGADAGQSDADQRHGQKDYQRHQNGAKEL